MRVAVGLGNPGKKYQATRHNLGFQVIDQVAAALDVMGWETKFEALLARGQTEHGRFMLVKPQTFMNNSGTAVQALLHFYKVPLELCLVVVDDLDLEVGKVRLREAGSDGGHRGLRSIAQCMGSQQYKRVRVGVGRPPPGESAIGRVLNRIRGGDEQTKLGEAEAIATRAVMDFLHGKPFENWSTS